MSIRDVIERARREPPYVSPGGLFPDNPAICTVFDPIPWDRRAIEQTLGFELPAEVVELWNICGGMNLYCDDLWLPWGLVVCSPSDESLFEHNNWYHATKSDCVLHGDLVIGKFLGIAEQALIRCDKNAVDYGSIVIALHMDPRPEWNIAASSLEEFFVKFMDARGSQYWTYHYQKDLAEKAAQELALKKQQN